VGRKKAAKNPGKKELFQENEKKISWRGNNSVGEEGRREKNE